MLSRLETILEWAQNTCEPPRIILHQNCHLSQWLPLSSYSRLLTPVLAVPYSSLCGSLHGYLSSCRRLLQALRPTRFPTMLFVIMHCCLFQLISAHAVAYFYAFIFVASITNNAVVYSEPSNKQRNCFLRPAFKALQAPHVLGLNVSRGGSARWHQLPARCTDQ